MQTLSSFDQGLIDSLVEGLLDVKADKLKTYYVKDFPLIVDVVLVCGAKNPAHLRALHDKVFKLFEPIYVQNKDQLAPLKLSGQAQSGWLIFDLTVCVIHVIVDELRDHYDLDALFASYAETIDHENH